MVHDFDEEVVFVRPINANQIRVYGESGGVTSLKIVDEFDTVYELVVFVEKDVRELQANIDRLFPGSAVRAIGVKDSIVLQGWVTQPDQIPRIIQLASTFGDDIQNHIEIGGGNLVQLQVRVLEVQRSRLEQFGFNFLAIGENYYAASTPGNLVPIAGASITGGTPTAAVTQAALANPQVQFAILGNSDAFQGFIEALKQESLLKIRAMPAVVTTSGRPATLHSGGEFPILVPQGIGTATIQWRTFGVQVETVPIVLGTGRVQLDIAAQVSDRDFSNSVDVEGFRVPGLTSRDVNTRVTMNFGDTLMIGGLISDRLTVSTNKIPVLGDMPYVGALFSRKNHSMAETELVILVTPHLVSPMSPEQVPCYGPGQHSDTTTPCEFLLHQHVEVHPFSRNCEPGLCPPYDTVVPPGYGGGYVEPYAVESFPTEGTPPGLIAPGNPAAPPTGAPAKYAPPTTRNESPQGPALAPGFPANEHPSTGANADTMQGLGPVPLSRRSFAQRGVSQAAFQDDGRTSRVTPLGGTSMETGHPRGPATTPQSRPSINTPHRGDEPGLVLPDYARPTPRFVGSSPSGATR